MDRNLSEIELSVEYFPPQTQKGIASLIEVNNQLEIFPLAFCSLTYGAGGSGQIGFIDVLTQLKSSLALPVVPHLSSIGATRAKVSELLGVFQALGVKRLVALRGDRPSGSGAGHNSDFRYAYELVAFIREETGSAFHIDVAVYPELHPEATSWQAGLEHLKAKVKAGASSGITQYFYNADAYYNFLEECARQGINLPITPGIMPITNYEQLTRFSQFCGAEIPRWLLKELEVYRDDAESLRQLGEEVVSRLCEQLLGLGAPGLHFYTLNKPQATLAILNNLFLAAE